MIFIRILYLEQIPYVNTNLHINNNYLSGYLYGFFFHLFKSFWIFRKNKGIDLNFDLSNAQTR